MIPGYVLDPIVPVPTQYDRVRVRVRTVGTDTVAIQDEPYLEVFLCFA